MSGMNGRPGQYRARNRNAEGRRIHFALPRSRSAGGGINAAMRELLAVIAEGMGRGEEA